MGKVLLIGGSPMIGKSTVAKAISSMYGIRSISTDDIGEMLQTAVDINPMQNMNYLNYYENVDFDVQIRDMKKYHKEIEKAIMRMIQIHSSWGDSMVIEGYAIYPKDFNNENVDAIWLIASKELLASRLSQSAAFKLASSTARDNYLRRSIWHNEFIAEQCKLYHSKYILITGAEKVGELASQILNMSNDLFKSEIVNRMNDEI